MAPTPPPPAPTPPPPAPAPKPPATGLNELPPPAIAGLILVFGAVVGLITGGIVSFGEQRNWDLSASDRQLQDFLGGDSSPSAVYGIQHLIYLAANVVRALALLVVVGALVGVVVTGSRWLRKRNAG
jgi:amino acid transporter